MEAYTTALLYAIPAFFVLLLIEISYSHLVKKRVYNPMDTISSLSSGLTNIIKDSSGLILIIVSYPYLLDKLALFEIKSSWSIYLIGFICIDFASYWNHRLSHKINFFWNQHVIHHSSEEFNLACALRQSISNLLGYFSILLIPAALFGVPNEVISILAPLHLFAQFWYHTTHVGKLGILEYIFVTPSQHRVHHAINKEYIDKNLSAIFCIWDRAFGTFQEELDDIPPVYGVLKPVHTWNPILINFQHIWSLIKDAWRTNSWTDKLKIWFMPAGWRPKDVAKKFPITIIEHPYKHKKYDTKPSNKLIYWSFFQLNATTILLLFMLYNFEVIGSYNLIFYGVIVFFGIYGYSSLMDHSYKSSMITESLFCGLGLYVLINTNDWFGLNQYLDHGRHVIILYFLISFIGTFYFVFQKNLKIHHGTK